MLATLLDQFEGMVYLCRDDPQWTMEFVSDGCFDLTGYRPEELLFNRRVSYEEVMHPGDRAWVRESIGKTIRERRRFDLEYRICRADGAVRWVRERGTGVFGAGGALQGMQGFIQDVTRRRENEHALRDAERRYRSIFEHAIEGIFQTSPEGRYLAVNPALARIYGYDSTEAMMEAMRDIGRQLYVDPERRTEFIRRVKESGRMSGFESQVFRQDGAVIWISENAREVRDADGILLYYEGTVEDVTERKSWEHRLEHLATHDGLTGLPNRVLFRDRLEQALRLAEREGTRLAVVFVDLDNFKAVNDTLGHAAGDRLIRSVAERLRESMRDSDTVARLGGDEFVVLMPALRASGDAFAATLERVLQGLRAHIKTEGRQFGVTCSMGVAVFPDDARDADALLVRADEAMYRAKQAGKDGLGFAGK